MSTSTTPVTFSQALIPAVQASPALQQPPAERPAAQPVPAPPVPTAASQAQIAAAPQTPPQQNAASDQNQIQQKFLEGESVTQIASETGLSENEVDIELGLTAPSISLPQAAPNSATAPAANAAEAVATYAAAPGGAPPSGQAQTANPGTNVSIEA